MRTVSFTRDELHQDYPELARAYDELLASDPKKWYRKLKEYSGKFKRPSGEIRRSRLDKIIETLLENGYQIRFEVARKK